MNTSSLQRTGIAALAASCWISFAAIRIDPPRPRPPVPSQQQIAWQKCETNLFLHFGINTFTDREWGLGAEDPRVFNPARLDARQWVSAAKAGGFKIVILTAKHHDGFCLWPSRYTTHSVRSSPWRAGKGDVVRELSDACRIGGLKLGLYLSPWDRHEPSYGDSPRYNDYYINQLTELLTGYGPIAEVWFDGACGEGPNGRKQEYDWERIRATVRKLQPDAIMFSDAGPDVRWIGNEQGVAGDPCWSTIVSSSVPYPGAPGNAVIAALQHGDPAGDVWRPGESDVSIRPGWFWHKKENEKVRSVENLVDLYFKSVGRNSLLLLNVPPDDQGLLGEIDVKRLADFRASLDLVFKTDLAAGKRAVASNVRGGSGEFAPLNAFDEKPDTYWATDDTVTAGWIEVDLGARMAFNVLNVQEAIALGQRVEAYHLEYLDGQVWKRIVSGTTIGHRHLDRFETVTARRVRLSIDRSLASPAISSIGLHFTPPSKSE
jgi:alpha-L-fucosidase